MSEQNPYAMKKHFSLSIFLFIAIIGFSFTPEKEDSCSTPQNVSVTSIDRGDITFDWDDCISCNGYIVKYYHEEGNYWSGNFSTTSSTISFTELPSGNYDFYFATDCGTVISSFIIIEEQIAY